MKNYLKNRAGSVIAIVIVVVVLAVAGGGAGFLTARMLVSGDGDFLEPFKELGWIDESKDSDEKSDKDKSKDEKEDKDDEDEDEDSEDDEDKEDSEDSEDSKEEKSKDSGKTSKYLVDNSRLSSESKGKKVKHYYGDIPVTPDDSDDEFADLYDLVKAGLNIYTKNGKIIEFELGFDLTDFCEQAYEKYKDELNSEGVNSVEDLEKMLSDSFESVMDFTGTADDGTPLSEYIDKYVDGGSLQIYITDKGLDYLYEKWEVNETDEKSMIDSIAKSAGEAFDTTVEIKEVK